MYLKTQGPISIVPFTIYNRPAFIEQDHPVLNPREEEYEKYWFGITEKCLYGLWGLDKDGDKGGWRWMPGNLYFYINITKIEIQGEDNTAEQEHPTLRDVTWLKSYGFNTCEGFSGFSEDEEYTCFRPIQKIEQGIKLKHIERKQLEKEAQYILKPDGSYKKYIEAREYLYQTFDRPMGKPLWRNEAKNFLELTTRGVGKSYELSNTQICYDYVFNGCKNMDDLLSQKKATVIVVGSSVSKWSDDLLNKFSVTYEYLRTNCGYYFDGFEETFGWFWQPFEGQLSISGKPFTNRTQLAGGQGYIGAGSKIYNVSYYKKDNAGIGKRARKFITDEAGTLENFKKVHGLNSAAQIRESKYGFSAYSGTGGDLTEIEGIKDAFKNPKGYDILGYKDLFGFNNLETGLFIPVYYRKDAYRDKNGNINLQEAYEDELELRAEKAKESTEAYNEWIISYPFWPHEMFMQAKDNLFPTVMLEERLDELQGGLWDEIAKIINIEYTDTNEKTSVVWSLDLSGRQIPLNEYQSEKDAKNKKGAIVMYEPPMIDRPEPKYTDPLYIAVYDPVLKDGDGSSICAVIIFKFFYPKDLSKIQFNIVAEWYGRHETLDENHDVAFKMAIMYGAKLLPEINNADILRNGKDTMRWNWFQPKPKGALGEFNQTKQYDVGVLITPGMKPALAMYLNEIFNTVIDKLTYEEDGVQYDKLIKMASQINSIRVIQEALQYGEGNFDAISAMFLVSLVHRNAVLIPHTKQKDKETEEALRSYKRFVKKVTYKNQQHPAYAK